METAARKTEGTSTARQILLISTLLVGTLILLYQNIAFF
jgi:hypothetical protein